MAETPLAKKLIDTINALEQAALAIKELKDYLVPGKEDKEEPDKKPEKED